MNTVKIVDARMGRGKSSAAIRYMKENKEKRFLYITPLLTEVERICRECKFTQPSDEECSKSIDLKEKLRAGQSVSATHKLFYLMDDEALALIRDGHYTLIIDEEIEIVSRVQITWKDFRIVSKMIEVDEHGRASWVDKEYVGRLDVYKEIADNGFMYIQDAAMLEVIDPELFRAFDDVYMLTYLFTGSLMEAYMRYAGFEWKIMGVDNSDGKFRFVDGPDVPPPFDIGSLIHIIDNRKMNEVGEGKTAMSRAWYNAREYDNPEIAALRRNMDNFFRNMTEGKSSSRLWTTFKDESELLIQPNGRYRYNFLQMRARATNEYANRTNLAYMVNRFSDPNLKKFFYAYGIKFDDNVFALSEMIQWIWRSAIRNNQPINLYIPSKRMRDLLLQWIEQVSKGGDACGRAEVQEMSAS